MPRVTEATSRDEQGLPSGEFRHLGLLNDFVRIPHANGSSFASQFLYREFSNRGHDVTVVGPDDPENRPEELPSNHLLVPSLPFKTHPGVRLPMPTRKLLDSAKGMNFDVLLGQTTTSLNDLGVYLRHTCDIPYLSVNTLHLPQVYNVILPDRLNENERVNRLFENQLIPWIEGVSAKLYNQTDGLIVLSKGLKSYWRDRGVTAPIHVIPRAVDPSVFDREAGEDPFPAAAKKGNRLLVVCRQTREKGVERLLRIFAQVIAPAMPDATLTLVGDGPDYDTFRALADELGVGERTFFLGEYPLADIPNFYRHADLFLYTSLSETYGQVVSEALWCRLPAVALADNMGVSQQISHGENGLLIEPGPDESRANWRFGKEVVKLLHDPQRRAYMAEQAERLTRFRSDPDRCVRRYYDAFADARENCKATKHERRGQPLMPSKLLTRWTGIHGLLFGLGLMRPPSVVNRHGRRQAGWDTLRRTLNTTPPASVTRGGAVGAQLL